MNQLFSEINNCYNLKYTKARVKYKKKYLGILEKISKLNLIAIWLKTSCSAKFISAVDLAIS